MTSGASEQADVAAIQDVASRWTRAVEAADAAALGRLMTDDIVVIHGDGRVVSGREAVVGDFVRSFASLRVSQTVETEETVVAGDWAFDRVTVSTTVRPHGEVAGPAAPFTNTDDPAAARVGRLARSASNGRPRSRIAPAPLSAGYRAA